MKENAAAIERQSGSIDANSTRLANQRFLQQQGLDQNPELIGAINDRIKAEMELTEAMKPFKETMVQFDIGLSTLAASLLRLTAGRNVDGTEKSEQQQIQDRMSTNDVAVDTKMVGVGDYSAINGETQHQGGPIGKFYNWLFNVPDYLDGEASKAKALTQNLLGMQFNKLDTSKFGVDPENIADDQYRQFRMPELKTAADVMSAAEQRQREKQPAPSWLGAMDLNGQVINKPAESNIDQSMHTDIKIDVVVNAIDPNCKALGDAVSEKVDAKVGQIFRSAVSQQKESF